MCILHRGAAAYICGEETGLIESLEGKRAWPRIKPPFPAVEGLFRKPTVVNNVETVACVKHIIDRGVDWFRSLGVPPDPNNPRDPGSFGPKLYCLSGHVERPGCYEAPLGITVRELIDRYGGGVWKGRRAKAVIPGGISMGVLGPDELDCAARLQRTGPLWLPGLGTAAVVVMDETVPIIDFPLQQCTVLCPRKLRTVHALPRRHLVGPEAAAPHQSRARSTGRSGSAAGDRRRDRHPARHDDLRSGRRSCLAVEERDPQVPHANWKTIIKQTNPRGYLQTDPVPALEMTALSESTDRWQKSSLTARHWKLATTNA